MFRINVLLILLVISLQAFSYTLKDPTKPSVITPASNDKSPLINSKKTLRVSSIVINSVNQYYAIINNELYHLGEKIQGVEITEITKNYISLADGRKLVVFEPIIKKQRS